MITSIAFVSKYEPMLMNNNYPFRIENNDKQAIKQQQEKTINKCTLVHFVNLITRLQLAWNCVDWNFSSEINMKLIRDK